MQDEKTMREAFVEAINKCPKSNKEIARELGISLSTVQRWKAGKTYPHPFLRETVASVIGPWP